MSNSQNTTKNNKSSLFLKPYNTHSLKTSRSRKKKVFHLLLMRILLHFVTNVKSKMVDGAFSEHKFTLLCLVALKTFCNKYIFTFAACLAS